MTQPIVQQIKIKTDGAAKAESDLRRVRSSLTEVDKASKSSGLLNTARSAAGAAGGALATVGGSAAGGAIGSILNLASVLGPLGAVAGVATVGIGALSAEIRKSEEDLRSRIAIEQSVARAIRDSTSEQLLARRAAAQDELEINQEIARQRTVAAAQYMLDIANQPLALGAALAGLDGTYNALKGTMEEATTAVANSQITVDAYSVALGNNVVATNNATAAVNALTAAQLKDAELAVRIDNMTAEQRDARASAVARELELLFEQQQAEDATGDTILELNDRIQVLNTEYQALIGTSSTYADQLSAENAAKQALTERNDMIIDLVDQEVEAREKQFSINQEIADIEAERAAAATKVVNETEERRAEILSESAENQQEMAEDNAREIEKIQRDFNRSFQTAVGERDAYGAEQAEDAAQDRIEDQVASDEQQAKATAKADAKALSALEKAKNQQLTTIAESAFRETNLKLTAARQQELLIAQTQASQTFLAANGMINVNNAHATGWQIIENTVISYATRIAGAVQGILGGSGGGSGGFQTLTNSAAGRALDSQTRSIVQSELSRTLNAARGGRTAFP